MVSTTLLPKCFPAHMAGVKVLAFYYKYLAAAEPLTDVLFGKEVSAPL